MIIDLLGSNEKSGVLTFAFLISLMSSILAKDSAGTNSNSFNSNPDLVWLDEILLE